ncbi:MAG: peptide chain release factor N(5)-glutamine methyltransferase, partial [Candidatus Portnoybacteria bacterium CG10_big_fil_rev_8_21_14_0_10_44_7]
LWAGADGLHYARLFLSAAKNYLRPGGQIYLEFGAGQKIVLQKSLKKFGYQKYNFQRDQFGRWRFVVVQDT